MTARIPEHVRAKILADYARGLTAPTVARKYGVGTASVYRIAHGEQARRGRKFPTYILDAAVQDYLESGDTIRTVAGRHPMSEDTLRLEIKERELTRPTGATIPSTTRTAAIDDFLDGMQIADISKKHGVARSTISAWLAQDGVGIEDRVGESPGVYEGGWVMRGGILHPAKPARRVSSRHERPARGTMERPEQVRQHLPGLTTATTRLNRGAKANA